MTDVVEAYRRDGFAVLPGALPPGQLATVRNAVERVLQRTAPNWRNDREGYRAVLLQHHQASLLDSELNRLVRDPRLAVHAGHLSGMNSIRVFLDQTVCKLPGAAPTIAHQDAPFLSFDDRRSVNCWIALDDVTAENGALEYLVGSHRFGHLGLVHLDRDEDLLVKAAGLADLEVQCLELSAGDAVFHNCLTVHRAGANRTSSTRRAFSIQYMPAGAKFNGWMHPFLEPFRPAFGDALDFECFPLVADAAEAR